MVCIVQPYTPYITIMPRESPFSFVKTPEHLAAEQAGKQREAEHEAHLAKPETQAAIAAARDAAPPWESKDWSPPPPPEDAGERLKKMKDRLARASGPKVIHWKASADRRRPTMVKLKAVRKKLLALSDMAREEAFDYWIGQHVAAARQPDEWTRSALLYENYLKHAVEYGRTNADKKLATIERATETRFGKLMSARYPEKRRRRDGWYYPVRLKRGA